MLCDGGVNRFFHSFETVWTHHVNIWGDLVEEKMNTDGISVTIGNISLVAMPNTICYFSVEVVGTNNWKMELNGCALTREEGPFNVQFPDRRHRHLPNTGPPIAGSKL